VFWVCQGSAGTTGGEFEARWSLLRCVDASASNRGHFVQDPAFPFKSAFQGKAQLCHTVGIPARHHDAMEDIYVCPDCRAEHAEPFEPALGHIARCMSCAMLLEMLYEQALGLEIFEIRIAA
jgi:hypothetical protein